MRTTPNPAQMEMDFHRGFPPLQLGHQFTPWGSLEISVLVKEVDGGWAEQHAWASMPGGCSQSRYIEENPNRYATRVEALAFALWKMRSQIRLTAKVSDGNEGIGWRCNRLLEWIETTAAQHGADLSAEQARYDQKLTDMMVGLRI